MARKTITAKQAISSFERAVRAHEMMGAQPPEDHEAIERDLEKASLDLHQLCAGITLTKLERTKT